MPASANDPCEVGKRICENGCGYRCKWVSGSDEFEKVPRFLHMPELQCPLLNDESCAVLLDEIERISDPSASSCEIDRDCDVLSDGQDDCDTLWGTPGVAFPANINAKDRAALDAAWTRLLMGGCVERVGLDVSPPRAFCEGECLVERVACAY